MLLWVRLFEWANCASVLESPVSLTFGAGSLEQDDIHIDVGFFFVRIAHIWVKRGRT